MSLKNPALQGGKGFLIGAGVFAAAVAHKLEMTFEQLVEAGEVADGDVFSLTDSACSVEGEKGRERLTPAES